MKKENTFHCLGCPAFSKSIFANLDAETLTRIHERKNSLSFRKGEALFEQGQAISGAYCLCSGAVKATQTGIDGKASIVRLLSAGEMVGGLGLHHPTGAYPVDEVKGCFFAQEDLTTLFKAYPELSMNALKRLYEVKDKFQKTLALNLRMNVKERTCYLIWELMHRFGRPINGGVEIDIALSREEMASMIGVASETLIRVLSELKTNEIITQNGRKIIVLKAQELIVKPV